MLTDCSLEDLADSIESVTNTLTGSSFYSVPFVFNYLVNFVVIDRDPSKLEAMLVMANKLVTSYEESKLKQSKFRIKNHALTLSNKGKLELYLVAS